MAEALQSTGVILPDDLLPDDTKLVYDKNGIPYREKEKNPRVYIDEFPEHPGEGRFIYLAMAYYNAEHNTDYEPVERCKLCLWTHYKGSISISTTHCGFFAAPIGCETAVKYFSSEIFRADLAEPVVTSCFIVDGTTPTGCLGCKEFAVLDHTSCRRPEEEAFFYWENETPPLSEYADALADGVKLSEKAKFRLRFTLRALAHYNKKNRADYKLVDVLPYAESFGGGIFIAHCNFIAKRNAPDASNELFFAELARPKGDWLVIARRIVRGKARVGCHSCRPVSGKRVIHPTRGYRFGLRRDTSYLRPLLRSQTKSVGSLLYKPS